MARKVKGSYVRCCLVCAMYLSAPEVALSTWGTVTNVELLNFFLYMADAVILTA